MSQSLEVIVNLNPLFEGPLKLSIRPQPSVSSGRFVNLMLHHIRGINGETVRGHGGEYRFMPAKLVRPTYAREAARLLVAAAVGPDSEISFANQLQMIEEKPSGENSPDESVRALLAGVIHGLRRQGRWPDIGPLMVEPIDNEPGLPAIDFATNYQFGGHELPVLRARLREVDRFLIDSVTLEAGGHNLSVGVSDGLEGRGLESFKAFATGELRGRILALAMAGSDDLGSSIPSQPITAPSWYNELDNLR